LTNQFRFAIIPLEHLLSEKEKSEGILEKDLRSLQATAVADDGGVCFYHHLPESQNDYTVAQWQDG
jgi:hypothetical protein